MFFIPPKIRLPGLGRKGALCLPVAFLAFVCVVSFVQPVSGQIIQAAEPVGYSEAMLDSTATMEPTVLELNKENTLIEDVYDPELLLQLEPAQSIIIRTRFPVSRSAVSDSSVCDVQVFGTNEIEILGKKVGKATLTFWFEVGQKVQLLRYLVKVDNVSEKQVQLELRYKRLQSRINEIFPNSQVFLFPIEDKVIVKGQAADAAEASEIMRILNQSTRSTVDPSTGQMINGTNPNDPLAYNSLTPYQFINLLRVPGEQQVMLRVRVAELVRSSNRQQGVDFRALIGNVSIGNLISGGGNISAILEDGDVAFFLKAISTHGYGKILAEPTLVTISGKPARFLAGGEFAVPTTVGIGGAEAATTTFRGFGTELEFTPTVMDKDLVRLEVSPSFSTLNDNATVAGIPGLNRRSVQTTVDLREGQWLAIAGLIQDEQGGQRSRVPFLGDAPLVGTLLGNQSTSRFETELIVLVSPELIHPVEAIDVPLLLPGMEVTDPTDRNFYLQRMVEGYRGYDHRSTLSQTARTEAAGLNRRSVRHHRQAIPGTRMRNEAVYVSGPTGLSK